MGHIILICFPVIFLQFAASFHQSGPFHWCWMKIVRITSERELDYTRLLCKIKMNLVPLRFSSSSLQPMPANSTSAFELCLFPRSQIPLPRTAYRSGCPFEINSCFLILLKPQWQLFLLLDHPLSLCSFTMPSHTATLLHTQPTLADLKTLSRVKLQSTWMGDHQETPKLQAKRS